MKAKVIDGDFDQAELALAQARERFYLVCALRKMPVAMAALQNGGFNVYCPKVAVMKPPPLRTLKPSQRPFAYMMARPCNEPLFPGYFLVGLGLRRSPAEIFGICGVDHVGMHCENGDPVPVPAAFIAQMRRLEADESEGAMHGAIPGATPLRLLLEPGDLVRVLDGAFTGFTGTVEDIGELALGKLDGSARLGILLSLFGRENRATVTLGQVARIDNP